MEKKHISRLIWLAILVFTICFSAVRISNYKAQEQERHEAVDGLREDITCILAIFETGQTDGDTLNSLAGAFDHLHRALQDHTIRFAEQGNSYSGQPSFAFIASTFRGGSGNSRGHINGRAYHSLQADGVISDKELEFLTRIREGMETFDLLINNKASIRTEQILDFVAEMLHGWDVSHSDSPYYLLME